MKSNKVFFFVWCFSSKIWKLDPEIKSENLKFVWAKFPQYQELFFKNYLLSDMTYNTMHFCLKNWELGNISGNVWQVVVDLNKLVVSTATKAVWNKKFINWFPINFFIVKKKFYFDLARVFWNLKDFFFRYTYFFQKLLQWHALQLKLEKQKRELTKKKNYSQKRNSYLKIKDLSDVFY